MVGRGRRGIWIAAGAGALLAAGAASGVAMASSSGQGRRPGRAELAAVTSVPPAAGATVTVNGTGTASAPPDTLTLQIGATTTRSSAAAALQANDAEVARMEAVLVGAGVPRRGLQTSGLQLGAVTGQRGQTTGYSASDDLTVTMHALARAGAVIDAAASSVGNDVQIEGIDFTRSDTASLLATARARAIQQAAADAGALATASGARLGGVVRITDEGEQTPGPLPLGFAAASARSSSVPLQQGTTDVEVQVHVVYALEP